MRNIWSIVLRAGKAYRKQKNLYTETGWTIRKESFGQGWTVSGQSDSWKWEMKKSEQRMTLLRFLCLFIFGSVSRRYSRNGHTLHFSQKQKHSGSFFFASWDKPGIPADRARRMFRFCKRQLREYPGQIFFLQSAGFLPLRSASAGFWQVQT